MSRDKSFFKLKENGTTVRTEIAAGVTTFITMAYIIALNPNILTGFETGSALWNGAFLATCIGAAIGTISMAFLANKPFALAPGMGLNSFFAAVVVNIAMLTGMSYLESYQTALVIIFMEGCLFIVLTLLNVREKIIEGIPPAIRIGFGPAIGMMLLNIGFGSNVSIYNSDGVAFYPMKDFFGALSTDFEKQLLGDAYPRMVISTLTIIVGLILIAILARKKIKGAILLGMLGATAFFYVCEAAFLGGASFKALTPESFIPPFQDMADTTLFHLNFAGLAKIGWTTVITLIITLTMVDMFDTLGTLLGTATQANMVDKDGKMPKMKHALLADAIGTVGGSLAGTSTVTTFVESSTGVAAGGRTGLTALTTGLLFVASIFLAPIAMMIPAAATSCALIYVGMMMMRGLKDIDFKDVNQLVPVSIMLIAIPVSGSIGHGIGLGLIAYTGLMLCTGKAKQVSILTYILTGIFILKFFVF